METERLPSAVLRLVCDSIIDNLGEKSLRMLMTHAGLQAYYRDGVLPPEDTTPSVTIAEFRRIFAVMFDVFGERGIKPILLRAGRYHLQHFRQTNKTMSVLAGAAFKVLPTEAKIKLVLSRSVSVAEGLFHAPHRFYDTPEAYYVEILDCPYCSDLHAQHGICFAAQGFYTEAVAWATGNQYEVEEVECFAAGDSRCLFRISREPKPVE